MKDLEFILVKNKRETILGFILHQVKTHFVQNIK